MKEISSIHEGEGLRGWERNNRIRQSESKGVSPNTQTLPIHSLSPVQGPPERLAPMQGPLGKLASMQGPLGRFSLSLPFDDLEALGRMQLSWCKTLDTLYLQHQNAELAAKSICNNFCLRMWNALPASAIRDTQWTLKSQEEDIRPTLFQVPSIARILRQCVLVLLISSPWADCCILLPFTQTVCNQKHPQGGSREAGSWETKDAEDKLHWKAAGHDAGFSSWEAAPVTSASTPCSQQFLFNLVAFMQKMSWLVWAKPSIMDMWHPSSPLEFFKR